MNEIENRTNHKFIQRLGYKGESYPIPNLLVVQKESFEEFLQADVPPEKRKDEGLQSVFNELFPIEDIHGRYKLQFVRYRVGEPRQSIEEAKRKNLTYSLPVWATLVLEKYDPSKSKEIPEEQVEQEVYLCDMMAMTPNGTFIINGTERVIVNQLHRSPGVYFEKSRRGEAFGYSALLVPYRGPWIYFTIDGQKVLGVTISKRRRIPITRLVRALSGMNVSDLIVTVYSHWPLNVDKLEPTNQYRLSTDIKDSKDNVILKEGHVLTKDEIDLLKKNDTHEVYVSLIETKSLSKLQPEQYYLAKDVVDKKTGEVLLPAPRLLDEEAIKLLKEEKVRKVSVIHADAPGLDVLLATQKLDRIKEEESAIGNLYRTLRYTPPKSLDEAKEYIRNFFFSKARFYLARVGRFKLNSRLHQGIPEDVVTLIPDDIIAIVRRLLKLYVGDEQEDDVDDLANRRVRRVGELLTEHFRVAIQRLTRVIRERMLLERDAQLTPRKLINPRLVTASMLAFFTGERLSQFLDQTNPLAELTHKRRLSALGKGGLTRETASFEVRDVHPSHYGRLCPIETPEGQNIGLITSLTTYAQIDNMGFIRTPLRVVKRGKVTNKIIHMPPYEEYKYKIAPADAPVDPKTGKFIGENVWVRYKGGYPLVSVKEVDFMDVSPRQILSLSASLIPFIEHDDANRALMGSNMQRQAVPLLKPEPPIVGTGIEAKIARDSGAVVIAKRSGTVVEVDANHITIRVDESDDIQGQSRIDTYILKKFVRSNQGTCMNQRPIVKPGDHVKAGDVIADGPSTCMGELSLGKNLLVAFLPYYGYNFEDAIVVSERVVKDDVFTSIHISEYEIEVRETKLGPEEVTRDLPNVPENKLKNLDEFGIVRVGSYVKTDDILVGKISPKGERELLPEEKLIYAIFSEKAKDVKDTSKRVPPGVEGVVVDVIILSRKPKTGEHDPLFNKVVRERKERLEKETITAVRLVKEGLQQRLSNILDGQKAQQDIVFEGEIIVPKGNKFTKGHIEQIDFLRIELPEGFLSDGNIESQVRESIKNARESLKLIEERRKEEDEAIERGDNLPPGVLKLIKVYVAQKRKLQIGDKLSGRHGNKGVVAKIAPVEDMPFLDDGTPVDILLNPLGVPSRMNVGQILETILGWAGKEKGVYYACPGFEGFPIDLIRKELQEANLPVEGKTRLRDGITGEYYDFPVTVGYIYMLKLIHMVDDKVHARDVGPYSLITQQPVGGKSRHGGQRFGEMEVWALEAHGAAYALQEMLTIKSDDIQGRNRLYKALRRGEELPEPGLPVSFNVLVHTLRGLGLDIKTIVEKSDKKQEKEQG